MVEECKTNNQLLERVAEVYKWLDLQICEAGDSAGACKACGKCCDFSQFDHHLFVTTPELMYLTAKLGAQNVKPMNGSRCPYNVDGRCTVYEYRFAGCRIFYCKGDADFQSALSESAMTKFKSICTDFHVPYQYADLPNSLNRTSHECRPSFS